MSGEPTSLSISDHLATITLDDPERRNALSVELIESLSDNIRSAIGDTAARVLLLTNTGRTFCAGANLKRVEESVPLDKVVQLFLSILPCPKPVVARIAGHCVAGGVGLAASCDISIAASDVSFGFAEVRIGVAPAVIAPICIPKIGRTNASDLTLRGNRIGAERAAEIGLITNAVDRSALEATTAQVLDDLLLGSPLALAATKRLIGAVPEMGLEDALREMSVLSASLFASEDARAGIAAFMSKQPPPWVQGRE